MHDAAASTAPMAGLTVTWLPFHARYLVRVFADDARALSPWAALHGAQAAASIAPDDASALSRRQQHALRSDAGTALALGPDEWLMLPARTPPLNRDADADVAVVDVSSAHCVARIAGTSALALLMSGCGIDLRPTRFLLDDFAQTRLGPFAVLIHRVGDAAYDIHIERSLRDALAEWLAQSAAALERTQQGTSA